MSLETATGTAATLGPLNGAGRVWPLREGQSGSLHRSPHHWEDQPFLNVGPTQAVSQGRQLRPQIRRGLTQCGCPRGWTQCAPAVRALPCCQPGPLPPTWPRPAPAFSGFPDRKESQGRSTREPPGKHLRKVRKSDRGSAMQFCRTSRLLAAKGQQLGGQGWRPQTCFVSSSSHTRARRHGEFQGTHQGAE